MKFLIDAQLPPVLVRVLRREGFDAFHLADLDLLEASDNVIWNLAKNQQYTLITKDEDFARNRKRDDQTPGLIWLRLGNCKNQVLISSVLKALPDSIEFLKQGNFLVEITK